MSIVHYLSYFVYYIKEKQDSGKNELIFKFYKPNFVGNDTLICLKCSENEKYFVEIEENKYFGIFEAYLVQIKQPRNKKMALILNSWYQDH